MSEIKKQDRCPFCHGEMMHYDELGYVVNLCKSGAFGRCDSPYSEQLSQHTGDLRWLFFRSANYIYDLYARDMMLSVWLRYANRPAF